VDDIALHALYNANVLRPPVMAPVEEDNISGFWNIASVGILP
jgi:hypothetical protein